MHTVTINPSDTKSYAEQLQATLTALRDGALVIFPTETVYGVGANAAHPDAMRRLRELKGRSDEKPFTVHLGRSTDAKLYVSSPPPLLRRLVRKAWPGPLTLICEVALPEETEIARSCPAEQLSEIFHDGTVGLRCPDEAAARQLLHGAGVPVVASSANAARQPPPLDLQDALRGLEGQVEYAIDGGPTRLKAPSTIVEVRGNDWQVLRAGALDERTVRRMTRSEILFVCTGNSCRSPMAEYLFRHQLAQRLGCGMEEMVATGYHIASAGTFAGVGARASEGTSRELAQRDIDAREHRSQPLTTELIAGAERVFVMSPEHRDMVLDLLPAAAPRVELLDKRGPVPDPIGGGQDEYARCAKQVEQAVEERLEEFLNEDRDW